MLNLEQVGLLHVHYVDLPEIAADVETWEGRHPLLQRALRCERSFARILPRRTRRVLRLMSIASPELGFERVQRESRQHPREPWGSLTANGSSW
ncbi:MAG: hypothetical protein M5T61_16535 [Acidimicrobiia bacterium]|nr:hypothetical protein [Acidimicrobiia bacterium]